MMTPTNTFKFIVRRTMSVSDKYHPEVYTCHPEIHQNHYNSGENWKTVSWQLEDGTVESTDYPCSIIDAYLKNGTWKIVP